MKKDITKQGKGKVMKKFILIILMFILTLSIGMCQDIKQEKNAVCVDFGSVISSVEKFSPIIGVYYNRLLWKGFGINIGYQYNHYHKFHHEGFSKNHARYRLFISSHSAFIGINYSFEILSHFVLVPYLQGGIVHHDISYALPYYDNYGKRIYNGIFYKLTTEWNPIFSCGVKAGYTFSSFALFLSYGYYIPISSTKITTFTPWVDDEARPYRGFNIFHHELKISFGYKF